MVGTLTKFGIVALGSWMLIAATGSSEAHYKGVGYPYVEHSYERSYTYSNLQPKWTEESLYFLTEAIYHEARSEAPQCQVMVAQVVMARKNDWFYPDTVKEVVWQRKQFSYTHDGKHERMNDHNARFTASLVAKYVLAGLAKDSTRGSLYYFNPKLANPAWQHDYQFVTRCGNHDFYKRKTRK